MALPCLTASFFSFGSERAAAMASKASEEGNASVKPVSNCGLQLGLWKKLQHTVLETHFVSCCGRESYCEARC